MLLRRQQKQRRPQNAIAQQPYRVDDSASAGDPRLPGIAGYRGTDPLPKHAMPITRFRFVRPDGKE